MAPCAGLENSNPLGQLNICLLLSRVLSPRGRSFLRKIFLLFPSKVPWKRDLARINPNRYTGRPRAATAQEFLRVVKEIESRASDVTASLLICHGDHDVVCDPDGSKMLHQNASSKDKNLHLYPDMWHQLVGEPAEGVEQVFGDMFSWLEAHLPTQAQT